MTPGSLKALRAARRLADTSTACPPWCDRGHELTGDDRGISHECVVMSPSQHTSLEAYLHTSEMVETPGTLGPVSLAIFTTEPSNDHGPGWYVEIRADGQLTGVQEAVQLALGLIQDALGAPPSAPVTDLEPEVVDLVTPAELSQLLSAK